MTAKFDFVSKEENKLKENMLFSKKMKIKNSDQLKDIMVQDTNANGGGVW